MLHFYDRAGFERALTLALNPRLRSLLAERIAAMKTKYGDLTDQTELLITERGDTEVDVLRHVGFSPLANPIDGRRWPDPLFQPGWDYMIDWGGWFELIFTFGSSYACIVLIEDHESIDGNMVTMCRRFAPH